MGDRWVAMDWTKPNIIKALRTKVRDGLKLFLNQLELYGCNIKGLYAAQKEVIGKIFQSTLIDSTADRIIVRI